MLCLFVFATTGVLVRSGHAAASSPSSEDFLKLGHKTNFGYQEADVEVTVITGEPRLFAADRSRCRVSRPRCFPR